jgi:hypothetical protein
VIVGFASLGYVLLAKWLADYTVWPSNAPSKAIGGGLVEVAKLPARVLNNVWSALVGVPLAGIAAAPRWAVVNTGFAICGLVALAAAATATVAALVAGKGEASGPAPAARLRGPLAAVLAGSIPPAVMGATVSEWAFMERILVPVVPFAAAAIVMAMGRVIAGRRARVIGATVNAALLFMCYAMPLAPLADQARFADVAREVGPMVDSGGLTVVVVDPAVSLGPDRRPAPLDRTPYGLTAAIAAHLPRTTDTRLLLCVPGTNKFGNRCIDWALGNQVARVSVRYEIRRGMIRHADVARVILIAHGRDGRPIAAVFDSPMVGRGRQASR